MDPEWLRRHLIATERAGRIAAPRKNIDVRGFRVGQMKCEVILPRSLRNTAGEGRSVMTCSAEECVVLYAHGGGYVNGGLNYARVLAAKMAVATGFPVYTFAYRLAPEHPYPAALTDGMKMWDYLLRKGYSPERILLAGGRAKLDLEERGWHVYQQMPFPIARRAVRRFVDYVNCLERPFRLAK